MVEVDFNPDTDKIQKLFPGLIISSRIGSGGQKIVYEAKHPKHGKVALKLIKPGNARDKARILREIYASSKLVGNEFAKLYDYGEIIFDTERVLYIYEEFLEGQSLRQLLEKKEKLTLTEALRISKALFEILVKVNKENIVHRDIKPENIYVLMNDRIVLIDFGIARHLKLTSLTYDYALLGPLTPGYATPEQIRNDKRVISTRTDIFLVGIVLYECLVGYNPFIRGCSDPREALDRNLNYNPNDLSALGFSEDVSDFVKTCLQKHPNRRYASPEEALKGINCILQKC